MGDATRRGICERLLQGEQTISEVAAPYLKEMSFPAITKHLNVLEASGLIKRRKSGRTCRLTLQREAFSEAVAYLDCYLAEPVTPAEPEDSPSANEFEIGIND